MKKKKEQTGIYYTIIFFIAIVLVFPLISGNYFSGHDTYYHLVNIEALRKMILHLNFSKVVPVIGFDAGYGAGIFYPQLPHYCAAIFQLFTTNSFFGIKVTHFMVILLSGIFMFKLVKVITDNNKSALLGSIFYMTMPYFLDDVFFRDALNETFIFIFMPMVLMGLISLLKQDRKRFYIYFIIGYVGLVNSHLVCSVFFTITLLLFVLVNIKKFITKENIKDILLASIIIIILIMPSLIMLIEHKSLNMYVVFDNKLMGDTIPKIKSHAVGKKDYFLMKEKGDNYDINYFINIAVFVFAFLGCLYAKIKEKDKTTKNIIYGLILFVVFSVFLTSRHFPYEHIPKLLWSIQFAFRNMAFVVFGMSIIAAYGLSVIKDKWKNVCMVIAMLISLVTAIYCINRQDYFAYDEIIYDETYGMGWQQEYLPKQAKKNYDYLSSRGQDIKTLSKENSDVKINVLDNATPYLKFKIDNLKDSTLVELPRLYYLGYDIKQKTKNGKIKELKYSYDKYGFITIKVKEPGLLTVKYKGTLLYKITKLIRLMTIIGILLYLLFKRKKEC